MTLSQILVLLVLFVPLALVLWGKIRLDAAALSSAALLGILQFGGLGILGPANTPGDALKAIAGFSQPAVITLLGLFVLTASLDQTGVTGWVAQRITQSAGRSETRLVLLFTGATALFSLVMNNVAAGALLLPGILESTRRAGIRPSKLLIPVAFGSLLGGMATYFTTANIIASDLLRIAQPPQPALNMLHFLPTGGLIAVAGILYLTLAGPRLLPDRETVGKRLVREVTGRELEDYYQLNERLWTLSVQPGSQLIGQTLAQVNLGQRYGVSIPLLWRGPQAIISPNAGERLRPGDTLLVIGREERVSPLLEMGLSTGQDLGKRLLEAQGIQLAELIVAPHSSAIGRTLKEMDFRQRQGLTAVAMRRGERSYRTDVGDLAAGAGRHPAGRRPAGKYPEPAQPSLLFPAGSPRRSSPGRPPQGAAGGRDHPAGDRGIDRRGTHLPGGVQRGAAAGGVADPDDGSAYQAIEWPAIFQIAGMVAVSQAMVQTGLSKLVGDGMLRWPRRWAALGWRAAHFCWPRCWPSSWAGR